MEELVYIYIFVFKMCLPTIVRMFITKNISRSSEVSNGLFWVKLFLYYICIHFLYTFLYLILQLGPSRSWSYGSWIYNYLCNQCLPPLMLWVRISIRARCTTLCDKVCQRLATGRLFSPGFSTNNTSHHDITEILLKMVLNTIKQNQTKPFCNWILQHSSLNL